MDAGESLNGTHHVEEPPFALFEQNSPQHLFVGEREELISPRDVFGLPDKLAMKGPKSFGDSQMSSNTPPGLVESMMTDGSSSSPSGYESGILSQHGTSQYLDASSTFLMSSLPSVSLSVGGSSHLPHSRVFGQHDLLGQSSIASNGSIGFSQLMEVADDKNDKLGRSKMPVVPEEESVDESQYASPSLGTLISAAAVDEGPKDLGWFAQLCSLGQYPVDGLKTPLLGSTQAAMSAPFLSYAPNPMSVAQAKEGISAVHGDDESFEVAMNIDVPCSTQDIMSILANPELLKLWCNPIEALVVTSSSEGAANRGADKDREYEGEWIEATTSALESPPSNVSIVYSAGRVILETIGFSSYGKVTMFVERRRGQVGLTVGPFSGGVYAAHTVSVLEEDGRIRLVDRVRLTKDEDEFSLASMFLCGVFESLNRCLLPSVAGYMEQVTTSMANLRVLIENGEIGRRYSSQDVLQEPC